MQNAVLLKQKLWSEALSAFLGIDPGLKGAIAVLTRDPTSVVVLWDMPVLAIGKKNHIDIDRLDDIVHKAVFFHEPQLAVIEDVHSMPEQGIVSAFTFGRGLGNIESALVARKVPRRYVAPAAWKRLLGLGRDKDESRRLASRLFPAAAHLWPLKGHDGRAEAVLLAYYGSRFFA